MSSFDEEIKIFKATFAADLDLYEELNFFGMLAEHSSLVNQFLTFTDAQRTIFIKRKLQAISRDQLECLRTDVLSKNEFQTRVWNFPFFSNSFTRVIINENIPCMEGSRFTLQHSTT